MEYSSQNYTVQQLEAEQASFITKVYGWMTLALVITGGIAVLVAGSEDIMELLFSSRFTFIGLILLEFACVAYLSSVIQNISGQMAKMIFILYAALNGLTLSVIFLMFTAESIASTFFITAATFGVMSAYGYYTKKDLTTIGNLAIMGLVGIIMASIANFFFQNETLYWVTTYAGVLIFVGLIAYDTQKIKQMNVIGNEGTDDDSKEAIMGALALYLDFINLFLFLLRILGRRR